MELRKHRGLEYFVPGASLENYHQIDTNIKRCIPKGERKAVQCMCPECYDIW